MSTNFSAAGDNRSFRSFFGKMDRWLKRLILGLTGLLAAELVWVFGITPLLPLSTLEVSGVPGLDRNFILETAKIDAHDSYMTVDAREAEKALETLYQVESARVIKSYPDTVSVILEPRKPAAYALANINGVAAPVFFDKRGMIIKIGRDIRDAPVSPGLPVISGLIFEQIAPGLKLPPIFEPFLTRLGMINASAPELLAAISEIRIMPKPYNGFDLVLYPVNRTIKFRVESELNEDTLRYMILMIDVFRARGTDVDEVDLRSGSASYKVKGASSGY